MSSESPQGARFALLIPTYLARATKLPPEFATGADEILLPLISIAINGVNARGRRIGNQAVDVVVVLSSAGKATSSESGISDPLPDLIGTRRRSSATGFRSAHLPDMLDFSWFLPVYLEE
jgi:hypothetical protein